MNWTNRLGRLVDRHPVFFGCIFAAFILLALNLGARHFLAKSPTFTSEVLESIYGKNHVADYSIVLAEQGLGQHYFPFVEYVEKPRQGKFVNVSEQGTRCHYPDRSLCLAKGGQKEIWIFGGSTTFGYGAKDSETIPAYLSARFSGYKVVNFGAASYYSTLERIRFENLLTQYPPPRAVVFIDGLNDFYYYDVPDKTMVSDAYALILDKDNVRDSNSWGNWILNSIKRQPLYRLLEERFGASKQVSASVAPPEKLRTAIARLNTNHAIIEAIGDKLGISVLNVVQPIPLYGIGHKTSKVPQAFLNFGDHVNSGAAYAMIFSQGQESAYKRTRTLYLANFGISEAMYVDTVHYSPKFNQSIADEIYKVLTQSLN
jgi:hypothetical protein